MARILVCVGDDEYNVLQRRLSKSGHEVIQIENLSDSNLPQIAVLNLEKQLKLAKVFQAAIKKYSLQIPVVGYNLEGKSKPPSFCDEVLETPFDFRLLQRALAERLVPVVGKVLVAEDDVPSQHLIEELLVRLGFTCDIASNGKQALKMAESSEYRILLLDCHMPELSGTEVASSLREGGSKIPIIALTADPNAQWDKAGMNKIVLKPIHRDELMKGILDCLQTADSGGSTLAENATWKQLLDLDGHQPGFLQEIIQMFEEDAPKMVSVLEEAEGKKDIDQRKYALHKLKGQCLNLGFDEFASVLAELEEQAPSSPLPLDRVKDGLGKVLSELSIWKERPAA